MIDDKELIEVLKSAPHKRVFTINVPSWSKQQAEDYINIIIDKYKKSTIEE